MGTLLKDKIFAEVNNDTNDMARQLIKNYGKVTFQGDKRTLWYNGKPYGTSYYKLDSTGNLVSNPEVTDKTRDVFGSIRDHEIQDSTNNVVVMGDHNQASISNSLALGKYNKSTGIVNGETKNYIFTIGNGTTPDKRSNLMQVDDKGDLTTYSISYTKLDTSYVGSLGSAANLDKLFKSLLNDANYYPPQSSNFSVTTDKTESEFLVNSTLASRELIFTWKETSYGRKPSYDINWVHEYVNTNNRLPNGVTLQHLGYTNEITKIDWTSGYIYNLTYGSTIKPLCTVNKPEPDTSHKIYNGTNSYSFELANNIINKYTFTNIGIYKLIDNLVFTVHYDGPQRTYYEQLYGKDVYAISDDKVFNAGTCNTNVLTQIAYVGFNVISGIFESDENLNLNNTNHKIIFESLFASNPFADINNVITSGGLQGIMHKKSSLITGKTGNSKMFTDKKTPDNKSMLVFNRDLFNITSNTSKSKKYIFFAMPTGPENEKYYTNDGGTEKNIHWTLQAQKESQISAFPSEGTDPRNYIFDINLETSVGISTKYTFFVAKTSTNFNVDSNIDSNDNGVALRLYYLNFKNGQNALSETKNYTN